MNGAKATPEDFLPKPQYKPGQLPASVYYQCAEAIERNGK